MTKHCNYAIIQLCQNISNQVCQKTVANFIFMYHTFVFAIFKMQKFKQLSMNWRMLMYLAPVSQSISTLRSS